MANIHTMAFVKWSDVQPRKNLDGRTATYVLVDRRDETVRYVGVTRSGSVGARLAGHKQKPVNPLMAAWIEGCGGRIDIRVVAAYECGWQSSERWWIAWFRERGDLLNIDPGGAHRKGKRIAKHAYERMHRIAKSGPVKVLSQAEILALYGPPRP